MCGACACAHACLRAHALVVQVVRGNEQLLRKHPKHTLLLVYPGPDAMAAKVRARSECVHRPDVCSPCPQRSQRGPPCSSQRPTAAAQHAMRSDICCCCALAQALKQYRGNTVLYVGACSCSCALHAHRDCHARHVIGIWCIGVAACPQASPAGA